MTRLALSIVVVLGLAGLLVFFQSSHRLTAVHASAPADSAAASTGTSGSQKARHFTAPEVPPLTDRPEQFVSPDATTTTLPHQAPAPLAAPAVSETAESSTVPPLTILENMRTCIRQYGSAFGGNPVGNNSEITSALQGDNPKQLNFLKQDGNRVNSNGQLVDPWGTPYFFHQISGQETEIRSAGPDRVMYTSDDLVTR